MLFKKKQPLKTDLFFLMGTVGRTIYLELVNSKCVLRVCQAWSCQGAKSPESAGGRRDPQWEAHPPWSEEFGNWEHFPPSNFFLIAIKCEAG